VLNVCGDDRVAHGDGGEGFVGLGNDVAVYSLCEAGVWVAGPRHYDDLSILSPYGVPGGDPVNGRAGAAVEYHGQNSNRFPFTVN
jgi:hypothetical protein